MLARFLSLFSILLPAGAVERDSLFFEPNQGQSGPEVRYVARARQAVAFVTADSITLTAGEHAPRLSLRGAGAGSWAPLDPLPGSTSYHVGPRSRWVDAVRHYGRLVRTGVYPKIDWVLRGSEGRIEYDFAVAPGGDPGEIELGFDSVDAVVPGPGGELRLLTQGSVLIHKAPLAYQELAGQRVPVEAAYEPSGPKRVRFRLGPYDRSRPLVIDPVIESAAWLGGSGDDTVAAIGDDGDWIAGSTSSVEFPRPVLGKRRGVDAYLYYPATQLLQVFGGSGDDIVTSAAGQLGRIVLGGYTNSRDIEVGDTFPGEQGEHGGGEWDGFYALNGYARYLGGSGDDRVLAVSVLGEGYLLGGVTASEDFPLRSAWQTARGGGSDGFVAVGSIFSGIVASSYLGGQGDDRVLAVAAAEPGGATIIQAGGESSGDGFITTLRRDLPGDYFRVADSIPFAGSASDRVTQICVLGPTTLVAAGTTSSPDLTVGGNRPESFRRRGKIFLARLESGSSKVEWLESVGGSGEEAIHSLACSREGDVLAGGSTDSKDFALKDPLPDSQGGGASDGFIAKWDSAGSPVFISYYGGTGADRVTAVAIGGNGNIRFAGTSDSAELPRMVQGTGVIRGGTDIFTGEISHPQISVPLEVAAGKDLAAPVTIRLTDAGNHIGVPVTVVSSDARQVLASTNLHDEASASVTVAVGTASSSAARMIFAACLTNSGRATLTLSAPGHASRDLRVRCVPSALIVPETASNPSQIHLQMGAVDPETGRVIAAQPMRNGAVPVEVRTRFDADQLQGVTSTARLTPDEPDGAVLSFRPVVARPDTWITVDAGATPVVPGNQIRVDLRQASFPSTSIFVRPLAAGLMSQILYTGEEAGTVRFRSTDASKVLLTTDAATPGSSEVVATYRLGNLSPPVYAMGIEPGPNVRIIATQGDRIAESVAIPFGPMAVSFTHERSVVRRVPIGQERTLNVALYPALGVALEGYQPIPPGQAVIHLRSSAPNVLPLNIALAWTTGQSLPVTLRPVAPGEAVIHVDATVGGRAVAGIPLTVVSDGYSGKPVVVGKDLQVSVLAPVSRGPVTATSSDPSKVLLSQSGSEAGAGTVAISNSPIWVQGLSGEGMAEVRFSAPGQEFPPMPLRLVPSGFSWFAGSITATERQNSASVAAYALDPETLVPLEAQPPRGGTSVTVRFTSSNPALADAEGSLTLPGPSHGMTRITGLGPAEISIQQPDGFTSPAGRGPLRVLPSRLDPREFTLPVGTGLQAQLSNPGYPVTFTSSDPSRVLFSANPTRIGQASATVLDPISSLYIQALGPLGDVKFTITDGSGQELRTGVVRVVPATVILDIPGYGSQRVLPALAGGSTTLGVSAAARVPSQNSFTEMAFPMALRAGLEPIPLRLESSNPEVAQVETQPFLNPGVVSSPVRVRTGRAGSARISVPVPPGFSSPPGDWMRWITLGVPANSFESARRVAGKDLRVGASVGLGAVADELLRSGFEVRLVSADPARLQLASSPTGQASSEIVLRFSLNSGQALQYYVDGLADTGEVSVNISSPGFDPQVHVYQLVPAAFRWSRLTYSYEFETGQLASIHLTAGQSQESFSIRPGAGPLSVRFQSANPAIFVPVVPDHTFNPGTSGSFQIPLRMTGTGKANLRVLAASGNPLAEFEIDVAPARFFISPGSLTIGRDLQERVNVQRFGNRIQPVTITSSNPALVTVSDSVSSPGQASITLTGALPFFVQGLASQGRAEVRVSAPGFETAVIPVDLALPVVTFGAGFGPDLLTPLSAPVAFEAVLASRPRSPGATLRRGAAPVTVPIETSSSAGAVTPAQLVFNEGDAAKSFQFRATGEGLVLVRLSVPPGFADPGDERLRTVNTAAVRMAPVSPLRAPFSLVRTAQLRFNTPVGAGLTLTATSLDPSKVLLVASTGTAAASINLPVRVNDSFVSFGIAGLDRTGGARIRITGPGLPEFTFDAIIVPSALVFDSATAIARSGFPITVRAAGAALDPVSLIADTSQPVGFLAGRDVTLRTESSDNSIVEPGPPVTIGVSSNPGTRAEAKSPGLATLTIIQPDGFTEPVPRSRILINVQ